MPKIYDLSRRDESAEEKCLSGITQGDSMEESAMKLGLEKGYLFPKYRKLYLDFDESCLAALDQYCDKLENDLKYIYQKYDEKTARGMSQNIIKLLEFYNPKKYSPKQQHDINMTLPDIGKALDEAERRVVEATRNVVQLNAPKKKEIE
jgi:hypothetical protein